MKKKLITFLIAFMVVSNAYAGTDGENNLSKKSLSIAFQSLIMGLWLNQLDEPSKFSKSESKKICIDYLKTHFPKQFSRYS